MAYPGLMKGAPPSIIDFYGRVDGKDAHGRTLEQILNWNDTKLERCHDYIQILFPLPEGSMFSYDAPIIDLKTLEAFRSDVGLRFRMAAAFVRMLSFYGFEAELEVPGSAAQREPEQTQADEIEQDQRLGTGSGKGKAKIEVKADESNEAAVDCSRGLGGSSSYSSVSEKDHNIFFETHIARGDNFEQAAKNWAVRMDHNHLRITRILRCLRVLGLQKQCEAFYNALKDVYNDPKYKIGERSMMFWERAVRQPLHIAPDGTMVHWLLNWVEKEQTQD
ncbi:hypothetical protein N0V90_011805 [Kalmusia sp. IMI 367209]|nr:hypothetical protein N0V90_011805 [Kalmusia sp. IMI 367209]